MTPDRKPPDWTLALQRAREGRGWEDIKAECRLSELDAKALLWGRIRAELMMKKRAIA